MYLLVKLRATYLCKIFRDRQQNDDGVKTLILKIHMTGSIERQGGKVEGDTQPRR